VKNVKEKGLANGVEKTVGGTGNVINPEKDATLGKGGRTKKRGKKQNGKYE